jgi:hypothetical protein
MVNFENSIENSLKVTEDGRIIVRMCPNRTDPRFFEHLSEEELSEYTEANGLYQSIYSNDSLSSEEVECLETKALKSMNRIFKVAKFRAEKSKVSTPNADQIRG